MSELQVPMRQAEVEIQTTSGQNLHGSLYVPENPYYASSGLDDVMGALNDERDFVPFVSEDEGVGRCVLNKLHLLRVRLLAVPIPGIAAQPSSETNGCCMIEMSDGSRVNGRVLVDTPPNDSRTIDRLNVAGRFLPVASDEGIDVLQTRYIVRAS